MIAYCIIMVSTVPTIKWIWKFNSFPIIVTDFHSLICMEHEFSMSLGSVGAVVLCGRLTTLQMIFIVSQPELKNPYNYSSRLNDIVTH